MFLSGQNYVKNIGVSLSITLNEIEMNIVQRGFNKREKSGNLCEFRYWNHSTKVVVAEYVRGQLNIIGVGNEKSS